MGPDPAAQADGADHPEHPAALEVRAARRFLVSRAHELKIVNTVCPVTIRRQEDTIELAREVDLMVVVGGRNCANTKELTRLVRDRRQARDPGRERRVT